jgi:hypothetical protein
MEARVSNEGGDDGPGVGEGVVSLPTGSTNSAAAGRLPMCLRRAIIDESVRPSREESVVVADELIFFETNSIFERWLFFFFFLLWGLLWCVFCRVFVCATYSLSFFLSIYLFLSTYFRIFSVSSRVLFLVSRRLFHALPLHFIFDLIITAKGC